MKILKLNNPQYTYISRDNNLKKLVLILLFFIFACQPMESKTDKIELPKSLTDIHYYNNHELIKPLSISKKTLLKNNAKNPMWLEEDIWSALLQEYHPPKNQDYDEFMLTHLPKYIREIYIVHNFIHEVENGGFNQYYYNTMGNHALLLIQIYKELGLTELTPQIELSFIEFKTKAMPAMIKARTNHESVESCWERFIQTQEESNLPDFNQYWFKNKGFEKSAKSLSDYAIKHLDSIAGLP